LPVLKVGQHKEQRVVILRLGHRFALYPTSLGYASGVRQSPVIILPTDIRPIWPRLRWTARYTPLHTLLARESGCGVRISRLCHLNKPSRQADRTKVYGRGALRSASPSNGNSPRCMVTCIARANCAQEAFVPAGRQLVGLFPVFFPVAGATRSMEVRR
jgi:hypothetical protein